MNIFSYFRGIFLFLFVLLFFGGCSLGVFNSDPEITEACVNDECFSVEIADSVSERARGLMFREYLNSNAGMLFIFDEPGKLSFWMKDTLVPLDMIWIDSIMNVVEIERNVQPCKVVTCQTYGGNVDALYVLELNAGRAREIHIGDTVIYKNE